MDNTNIPVRLFFSKTGRAKYISHLDLYRTFQRAVKRAKIPVWETEGFNKHVYLTFALPLSLGIDGLRESLDARLTENLDFGELKDRINAALPADLRILEASAPVMKHTAIKRAEYEINADINPEDFISFLSLPEIITEKKTKKKGISQIDLKPLITLVKAEKNLVGIILPAGTELNINPALVAGEFFRRRGEKPEYLNIVRTGIFAEDGEFI